MPSALARKASHVKATEIMHLEAALKFGPAFIYNVPTPRERQSELATEFPENVSGAGANGAGQPSELSAACRMLTASYCFMRFSPGHQVQRDGKDQGSP